jgi:hypothetical protein
MRILILTHPRSGGMLLMSYIQSELSYKQYHEPFNNLTNDEIDIELLLIDNIVVKDFPYHIESKGYNHFDIISKFDKIIVHHRENDMDVAISRTYFHTIKEGIKKMHQPYKIDDEWMRDNKNNIEEMMVDVKKKSDYVRDLSIEGSLKTTYDGIYYNKSDIPKILNFLNITDPKKLDMLDNKNRLRNSHRPINDDKVKKQQKLI